MKTLWLGLLTLMLNTPLAAQEEDELTRRLGRQVEVVKELADKGVVDAYFQLALLARIHADEPFFSQGDALHYLTIAAGTGHPDSLRSLAFELLEGGDIELRSEVATLLAEAAILGQTQAAVDLKLVPKLTAITEQQIVAGFDAGLRRLAGSQALDCDALPPTACSAESAAVARLRSKDIMYARSMIARGPYPDAAAVHQVFNTVLDDYTAFSGKSAQKSGAELREEKARESMAAQELMFRRHDGALAAQKFLDQKSEIHFEQHSERIELLLGLINGHRKIEDQISIDAVRSQMEMSGDE